MRRSFVIFAAALAIASLEANAQQPPRFYSIPEQPLSKAILEFSRQSDLIVTVPAELLEGKTAPELKGEWEPMRALEVLLAGTGLKAVRTASGGITIAVPTGMIGETGASPQLRLAQTDSRDETTSTGTAPTSAPDASIAVEEIVVTGTHIRGADPFSPVIRATRDQIITKGYSRLDQFIDALPQNSAGGGSSPRSNPLPTGGGGAGSNNYAFASGVNLRGLGANATLVLLNGQRLPQTAYGNSVDISKIPLSALERVEILTDGASATYGADAVAGVMNVITRSDFNGMETGVRLDGISSGKDPGYGAYVLGGHTWPRVNALLTVDYQQDEPLFTKDRSFSESMEPSMLLPEANNTSVFGSLRGQLTPLLVLNADALVSANNFRGTYTLFGIPDRNTGHGQEYSARASLDYRLAAGWQTSIGGNLGKEENRLDGTFGSADRFITYKTTTVQWKADGALFNLPAGPVRSALGAEYRNENYDERQVNLANSPDARHSYAAYIEAIVPLVDRPSGLALMRELSLDLAVRYDHYDDFGASVNPKFAVRWRPIENLALHASYGTSFRAPVLSLLSHNAAQFGYVFDFPDPSSPNGTRRSLYLDNTGNLNLKAEESESINVGFRYQAAERLQIEASYFDIDFKGRIIRPSDLTFLDVITDAARFGDLILFDPTLTQTNAALATPGLEILDFTPNGFNPGEIRAIAHMGYVNAAVDHARGIDFSASYAWPSPLGDFRVEGAATRFFSYDTQVDPSGSISPGISLVGRPAKLRGNLQIGWNKARWSAYARLNYTDRYVDQHDTDCSAATCHVDAASPVDLGLAYTTLLTASAGGLMIGLDVADVFDSAPPFVRGFPVGYDAANSSPLGRAFSVKLAKRW